VPPQDEPAYLDEREFLISTLIGRSGDQLAGTERCAREGFSLPQATQLPVSPAVAVQVVTLLVSSDGPA
jgi:hypothetical protein